MNYNGKYSLKRYLIKESARTEAGSTGQYLVADAILKVLPGQYYAQVIKTGSNAPDLTIHDLKGNKVAQIEVKSNQKHQVPMELSVYSNVAQLTGYVPGKRATGLTPPHNKDPAVQKLIAKMKTDPDNLPKGTPGNPIVNDGKGLVKKKDKNKKYVLDKDGNNVMVPGDRDHEIFYVAYNENAHTGMDDLARLRHTSLPNRANARLSNWFLKSGTGKLKAGCPLPAAFKQAVIADVAAHNPPDDYYATIKGGTEIKVSSITGNTLIPGAVAIDPQIPKYKCGGYGGANMYSSRDVIDADVHSAQALTLSATATVPNPIPEIPVDPQTGESAPVAGGIYYAP